ncbi:LOW QUALITY PROTEIN: SAM and SH3 domain-containing protein 1 [Brienomyrus brachyistius]|uniref:LOW QUALITY PROTEIN: SAM and SH3 domain-containing protein 1 n=1 Tax=Brienomyrus brachyistius TaxID=42636 RepID=UPI0020B2E143|nr:LOW QUALITY PROTEIN: SAM and SH3 domain-containing protein 1 [Brienomyrus brachyistius]
MSCAPNVVNEWLKTLQLGQYSESFFDNGYDDLEVCKQIGDPDLDAIGVFIPTHRQRIREAVGRLKEEDKDAAAGLYFTLEPLATTEDIYTTRIEKHYETNLKGSKSWTESNMDRLGKTQGCMSAERNLTQVNCKEPVTYPKLKLKILIRDRLIKDGINLSQPPFSNKDGSLGSIDDLALEYSEYYNTCFGDVCERMEELRKRSVSQELETGGPSTTVMSQQLRSDAQEALGFSSAVSTPETERKPPLHKSSSEDGSGGRWESKKKNKSFWQNFRKLQKGSTRPTSKGEDIGFLASEITMSDEERIQLMMMVKERMITVEEALARLKEFETQTRLSSSSDNVVRTDGSSPSVKEATNFSSREQSDDELDDCVKFRRLHKLVNSTRRVKKKLIKVEDGKRSTSEERSSLEALPTCEDSAALYTDVVKTPGKPVDCSSPALVHGLFFGEGDPKIPTASPSTGNPEARSKRPGPLLVRSSSSQTLVHPGSGNTGTAGGGGVQDSPLAEEKTGRRESPKVSRSMTDSEMHRAHGPPAHGRTCSFGGFDLSNRSLHVAQSRDSSKERDCSPREGVKSPATPRISLGKKVKSVKETMKKRISKKHSGSVSEQLSPEGTLSSPQSPELSANVTEKPKLKAGGSVESLRSSLSGQSSMSGQTVSTTDSTASNRESVKSEDADEEELPYRGPFCGRARVHTDFTPSPYDTDSLKLKSGDVIDIISKPPMGTWMGLLNNKVGSFKFIYVDVLSEEAEKPKRPRRAKRKGRPPKPTSVEELLQQVNLKEYMATFLFNGYEELDTFKLLEEEDLNELNIQDPQHRAALLAAVEILQEDDGNSDSDRIGRSGSKEQILSDKEDRLGSTPRDSGCYASSENLETGKSRKLSRLGGSPATYRCDCPAVPAIDSVEAWLQTKSELLLDKQVFIKGSDQSPPRLQRSPYLVAVSRSCEDLRRPLFPEGLWERSHSLGHLQQVQGSNKRDFQAFVPKPSPIFCSGAESRTERGSKPRPFGLSSEKSLAPGRYAVEHSSSFYEASAQPITSPRPRSTCTAEVILRAAPLRTYPKKPPVPPPVPLKKSRYRSSNGPRESGTPSRSPAPPPRPTKPRKAASSAECSTKEEDPHPTVSPPWLSDLPQTRGGKPPSGRKSWHARAVDLESLLEDRLALEGIDLTEEPYSDKHGRCGIPPALVQRYSEDLDQPVKDIVSGMDHIRVQQLRKQHRMAIPLGGVTELGKRAPSAGQISTTTDWLVSIGLPMYVRSFTQAGFTSLEQVSLLTEPHVLRLGVKDERHVQLLLGAANLLRTQGAHP